MSQERPLLPTNTTKRYLLSRCFSMFAFCATFFGLAMLVVFLWGLGSDVKKWFEVMPERIKAENARVQSQQAQFEEADQFKKLLEEKEAGFRKEMEAKIATINDPEAKEAERKKWEEVTIPEEMADFKQSVMERQKTAAIDIREDTSSWGIFLDFFTNGPAPESEPQNAGIRTALFGTLLVVTIAMFVALPIGVGAAIFLEEYRADTWLARIIQVNINNLAGVPSIMFGILGASLFVEYYFKPVANELERIEKYKAFQERIQNENDNEGLEERRQIERYFQRELTEDIERKTAYLKQLKADNNNKKGIEQAERDLERSRKYADSSTYVDQKLEELYGQPPWYIRISAAFFEWLDVKVSARNTLGAGLTLALLSLPVIIVASQEAIRGVPQSLRHGSLALGATRWQTIWKIVLPSAFPGIMTGTILSMCRAIGEAAPLVMFGALLFVNQDPGLFNRFSVLPLQIFNWASRTDDAWRYNAALAGTILVVSLLLLNGIAIYFRNRALRKG